MFYYPNLRTGQALYRNEVFASLTLNAQTGPAIGCLEARGSAKVPVNTKKQSDQSLDHGLACGVESSFQFLHC